MEYSKEDLILTRQLMERRAIANRVTQLQISAIKEMAIMSKQVDGAASLTWGVPSFETPSHI